VRGVLDHEEAVALRDRPEGGQVGHEAAVVDRDHGAGAAGDRRSTCATST
jgi:hypothetical protein